MREDMGVDDDEVERGPVRSAASGFTNPDSFAMGHVEKGFFQCIYLTTDVVEESDELRTMDP